MYEAYLTSLVLACIWFAVMASMCIYADNRHKKAPTSRAINQQQESL